MIAVAVVFWVCLALVLYTYAGYGAVLWVLVRVKERWLHRTNRTSPAQSPNSPTSPVTLLICAYNERDIVAAKMANTLALDYPKDKLHIVWCTDGTDDGTPDALAAYPGVRVLHLPERRGKTAAMNRAMEHIDDEIVVMTDANTMLCPKAISIIAGLFADPTVGCVAGEKRVGAKGEGLYWKYESTLKALDSRLYSAMGAAGELCAVRRSLYEPVETDALLDDFMLSMRIVGRGYRIAYSPDAYAVESGSANLAEESKRKRRIAAGGLQSIWRLRRLMNPLRYPVVSFQFVGHRALRWSLAPLAMVLLVPLNTLLVLDSAGTIYIVVWLAQIAFYLAAFLGWQGKGGKLPYVAYYFLFMNINVFLGVRYLCTHKGSGVWEKTKRL